MKKICVLLFAMSLLCLSCRNGCPLGTKAEGQKTETSNRYPICEDDKWGYMDKQGQVVIAPQFDWADTFSEGLAIVEIGGKYGYIDTEGHVVIAPQFEWAEAFSEGLARVKIGDEDSIGYGYIDKEGKTVWSEKGKK